MRTLTNIEYQEVCKSYAQFGSKLWDEMFAGYVSEWDDWSDVNYNKLFDIIAQLVTQKEAN